MRYLLLEFGYAVKGRSVTCFLLPKHYPGVYKVGLDYDAMCKLSKEGNYRLVKSALDILNERYLANSPSYTVTCNEEDEFKEKVGKSLARRHLIIKVLSDFNDILDSFIKLESSRVKKLVEFKNVLHNIRTNTRSKNARTLERCEAEKNGR